MFPTEEAGCTPFFMGKKELAVEQEPKGLP